jgi:hypothetical protein
MSIDRSHIQARRANQEGNQREAGSGFFHLSEVFLPPKLTNQFQLNL